jgi:hypothetical protein
MASYTVTETNFNGTLLGYHYGVFHSPCFYGAMTHLWAQSEITFVSDSPGNSVDVRIYRLFGGGNYVAVKKRNR